MHKWAKEIMECLKNKVSEIGVSNIDGNSLEELKCWTELCKNITEYDYYYNVVKAMLEYDGDMDDAKDFYTPVGNKRMPKNQPNMNHQMHYTEPYVRDAKEGEAGMARKHYMETKATNSGENKMSMQALEEWLNKTESDWMNAMNGMTNPEKEMARNRIIKMANKIV